MKLKINTKRINVSKWFKWFGNLRIAVKLISVFLVIALLAGALGVFGIGTLSAISRNNQSLFTNYGNSQGYLGYVLAEFNLQGQYLRDLQIYQSKFKAQAAQQSTLESDIRMMKQLEKYGQTCDTPDRKAEYDTLTGLINNYRTMRDKVVSDAAGGDFDAAYWGGTDYEFTQTISQTTDAIGAAVDNNIQSANTRLAEDSSSVKRTVVFMIIIVVATVGIAVGLGMAVARNISKPIVKLSKAADALAEGRTDIEELTVDTKDEVGMLTKSFAATIKAVNRLIADTNMLTEAAVEGRLTARADSSEHKGDYQKIVEGINATLDIIVDKIFWYEALLDSIPLPVSVTDMNMNWTFVNKPVEKMLNTKRADMLGKHCSNWGAGICNTENCGVECLRKDNPRTAFDQDGMNFTVDTSYILNQKGQKIGHIEVVQDVTARAKVAEYIGNEVDKISQNLGKLAEGSLDIQYTADEGNEYTTEERKNFLVIENNLSSAVDTLKTYIGELSNVLTNMADGNLAMESVSDYKGDFAGISDALNTILGAFNKIFMEMKNASEQVASGSRQVSDGSQAISQGATEQASSIEELTASMAEIAEQTKQNAVNANRANELVIAAKTEAVDGNEQMKVMQQAMEEINESSAQISKVIKVIDDIAFQTNILALNAAVEAARAGVHGKGFAVVAEEVRNLAAKSATAAKETTAMIESSIKKAEAGNKIADKTASALNSIVNGVDKAAQLVGDISIASNEQATGIAQVNRGIEQMSQVVQTNSATSEEAAAASEELLNQAEVLRDMVDRFKLLNDDEQTEPEAENVSTKQVQKVEKDNSAKNASAKKPKIILNDKEFGKY